MGKSMMNWPIYWMIWPWNRKNWNYSGRYERVRRSLHDDVMIGMHELVHHIMLLTDFILISFSILDSAHQDSLDLPVLPSFLQTLFTTRQSSFSRYQSDLPSLGLWRRIPIGQSPLLSLLSQDIVGKIHTCRRSASLMGWFHGRIGLWSRLGRIGGIQFRRKSFRWYVLVISSDSAICL